MTVNGINSIKGAAEQILRRPLEPIELLILENSWENRTYSEIARVSGYASVYVREVGSRLWQSLSDALGARVTKKNLQLLLSADQVSQVNAPEFPSGPLAANSPLYIERDPFEQQATRAIRQSGCLLRLKAPRKMGRTSFLYRLMAEAKKFSYRVVVLNLRQVESAMFANLDTFLRWFCHAIAHQLGESSNPNEDWQHGIGSKLNCTAYLEQKILEPSKNPVVLALQELDLLFQYPQLVEEFLSLLRGWHEEAQRLENWQKLRVILSYSTDCHLPSVQTSLDIGVSLRLPEFTPTQVWQLAQRYNLGDFNEDHCDRLMSLLGGHPYLLAIALYHLSSRTMTLETLLQRASETNGIFGSYLRSHGLILQNNAELAETLYEVIHSPTGIFLDAGVGYQLESVGLIRVEADGRAYLACQLYRQFFATQLQQVQRPPLRNTGSMATDPLTHLPSAAVVPLEQFQHLEQRLEVLEQQMRELQRLHRLDRVTQVMNRETFDARLRQVWEAFASNGQPVSLLLCGIDFFNVYLESCGPIQAEICLQQVARTIRACVDRTTEDIGLYGPSQFAVLLSHGTAEQALAVANQIRQDVEALGIRHSSNYMGWPTQVVTVSIGVASTLASSGQTAAQLLAMAENGYKQAERQGHNCIKLLNF